MKIRTIRPWGAVLLAGTVLAFTVAPAHATSPGTEWMLVDQHEFDTWAPNPPSSDWMLVDQREIDDWQPYPDALGEGYWKVDSIKDRRYFLADGAHQRKLDSSTQQRASDSDGVSARIYGPDEITKRVPGEKGRDIKVPYKTYIEGSLRSITKLVRYDRWEDQDYLKPWSKHFRFKDRTRDMNVYRFEWKDPITNEALQEIDTNVEYTAWVFGASYNKGIESQGEDPGSRRVTLPSEDREELFHRFALGLSALSSATSDRAGIFKGDAGSSGKAELAGSKLREKMGANAVKASQVPLTQAELEEAQKKAEEDAKKEDPANDAPGRDSNSPDIPSPVRDINPLITLPKALSTAQQTTQTVMIGGKTNAINYFNPNQLPANISGKAAGKFALTAGAAYTINAVGTINKGGGSVSPASTWNSSLTRLQVVIFKPEGPAIRLNYTANMTLRAADYPRGSSLGFVFCDGDSVHDLNNNSGSFTVTVTTN